VSRIDDLIAKLCPNGVEFKRLGDLARIRNGGDYKHLGRGDVPVYGTGGIMTRVDTAAYSKPSVLIPRKGSLDKLYYVDGPFWTVDTIFYTEIGNELVPKFFYYFLATQHLEDLNQAGGIPSLTQSVLNEIKIPVPPLQVQDEIVRALNLFMMLEAELEAELKARRQQFAYCMKALMTFAEDGRAKWATLGELGEFIRGRRFTKDDYVDSGLGCIHYGQIYTDYGTTATRTITFLPEEFRNKLRLARPGDLVIAATGENVEDVCKAVAWLGTDEVAAHDDCFIYRHELDPTYASYLFQSSGFQEQKVRYVSESKVVRISGVNMAKIRVQVPPLEDQKRIVEALNSFDALINDPSSGLPAEIAARRTQYEHYRHRLMTFKELAA